MLTLKYLLIGIGAALLLGALGILAYDLLRLLQRRRRASLDIVRSTEELPLATETPVRWGQAGRIAALGILPLLAGFSITVIPGGFAGVRVSQVSGPLPGTLYPGAHILTPLVEDVQLYSTRDSVYMTIAAADSGKKAEGLQVQAREG